MNTNVFSKELKFYKKSNPLIKILVAFILVVLSIYLVYPYWPKVQYHFTSLLNKESQNPISYPLLNTNDTLSEETIRINPDEPQKRNVRGVLTIRKCLNLITQARACDVITLFTQ